MAIAVGDWKLSEEKIPYPLFVGCQKAVFIEDTKGHPVALVSTDNANLFKAAPKMLETLEQWFEWFDKKEIYPPITRTVKVLAEAKGEGGNNGK